MKKSTILLVVAFFAVSAGCSTGSSAAPDPFFGQMTISPPSTQPGSVAVPNYASTPGVPNAYTPPTAATTTPSAVAAAPVDRAWASPLSNFTPGSTASAATASSVPGQPIYFNPNAVNTQPINSTPGATPSSIAYGQPASGQSSATTYRSGDGTNPPYSDPRSSLGQSRSSRFYNVSGASSTAPGQPGNPATGSVPTNLSQGTPVSGSDFEKMLPPIRGYASNNRTARAQSTSSGVSRAANMPAPSRVVNLADLPDANPSRMATQPSDSPSNYRRLSYDAPVTGSTGVWSGTGSASPLPSAKIYGHNNDYTLLRGELDYSQITQCWTVRYIPIDEKMDDYGGSVVLSDTTNLSGLERGQFVEVRGRVLGPQDDVGYARSYEVQEIRRIE